VCDLSGFVVLYYEWSKGCKRSRILLYCIESSVKGCEVSVIICIVL
jgi:hypothetical protein